MSLDAIELLTAYVDDLKAGLRASCCVLNDVSNGVGGAPEIRSLLDRMHAIMMRDPRNPDRLGARMTKSDTIPVPAPCMGDDDDGESTALVNGVLRELPYASDTGEDDQVRMNATSRIEEA